MGIYPEIEDAPKTVPRPFPLWRRFLYLAVIAVQATLLFIQGRHLDASYQRELEYARQASTLIAENKRLREHCPQATSGSLALNEH